MGLKPLNASGTIGEAGTIRDAQGYDRFLSQVLAENNTYHMFFTTVPLDETSEFAVNGRSVLGAAYGGRNCDKNAVGCTFLPLTDFEQDEFGQLKDKSGMGKYARIASIFHEAMYRNAIQKADDEARKLAEDNDEPVNEVDLAAAKKKLDQEYHGDRVNDVNVPPKINPVIRGMSVFTFVSAVIVKLLPDGQPSSEKDAITRVTFTMSKTKAEQLNKALKGLRGEQLERDYIEIKYAYNGATKQEAGRMATLDYVDPDSELRAKYPNWWAVKGKVIESMMIKDLDSIAPKNQNIANPLTNNEVIINFKKWLATNRGMSSYIDFESPTVKNAASDLLEIDAIRSMKKARIRLEEIVAEAKENEANGEEENAQANEAREFSSEEIAKMKEMQEAGTLAGIIDAAGGMDSFGELGKDGLSDEPGEL